MVGILHRPLEHIFLADTDFDNAVVIRNIGYFRSLTEIVDNVVDDIAVGAELHLYDVAAEHINVLSDVLRKVKPVFLALSILKGLCCRIKDTYIRYQDNNDKWIFTEYCGQYGWIRTVDDDGKTPTIIYEVYMDKPVIYLYPEKKTDVHVELELTESELSTTYPRYNNGWDVTAYPDGKLVNKTDGTHHRYLFWDAVNCRTRFDFSKGFCVAGSDTESFLKEKLTYMGLTEDEMNEFIVYWLPLMEHNKYNLISFQGDVYTDSAKLNITPTPDSMLRIFMTYVPLEEAVDIEYADRYADRCS